MSTDLEKAAPKTPAVITTPEEFRGALLRWQDKKYNVLTPFANISGLAVQHGIVTTLIHINPDKAFGEAYDGMPFLKSGEVALAKNGLRKIAEGLGISIRLEYVSVGVIRHYWHVKAIASYRGIDGSTIQREASEEWDLRDGSDRLKGWNTPNQLSEGRKHGLRNCETRAINAAIRECGCGVKQAYHKSELERDFLAVRVAFQPDMNDADTRRLVTERALSGTSTLYPSTAPRGDPFDESTGGDDTPADGIRNVGRGSTTSAAASETATSKADERPTVDAVRILKVEEKKGETKGKPWTRFIVIDSTGLEASTFDAKLADAAKKFAADKTWVEVSTETQGQFVNLIEITIAGQQPSLLPATADL